MLRRKTIIVLTITFMVTLLVAAFSYLYISQIIRLRIDNAHETGVEPYGGYGHPWNSATVNGGSVGPYSFGVQWTNSQQGFDDPANCACLYTLH